MANVTYTVKAGDNLTKIANAYKSQYYPDKTTEQVVDIIANLNNLKNKNYIVAGQTLVISGTATSPAKNTTYRAIVDRYGLVANTERQLYAGWNFDQPYLDHYEYRWSWSWGIGIEQKYPEDGPATTKEAYSVYTIPEHATHATFIVKPVAKTHKVNGVDTPYWTGQWSTRNTYWFKNNPPKAPNQPTVEIKDYTLTATIESGLEDLNADSIEFHVYQDNGRLFASETVKIVTYYASCTFTIEPGHTYKVQARSWRDGEVCSEWSSYSGNQTTKPAASDGITTCRANSSTSVYLAWSPVANATSYDVEYATKKEYFDSSNQTFVENGIETSNYLITGLESGNQYFFRVRAVNANGHSAWSDAASIVLGKKPAAPTTWSSTTTAVIGESVTLYWVHNSEDGSKEVKAELELTVNGETTTQLVDPPVDPSDDEAEAKTNSYTINTSGYTDGVKLQWRVRTCGITGEYGDWSIQREADIYAPATLSLNVTDLNGNILESLTSFPFHINGQAGPNSQKPVGYYVSIVSEEAYETVDHVGNKTFVTKGGEVYSKHFDISENLDTDLSANDVDLENNIRYTLKCMVTMNSGLSAEASSSFVVAWRDDVYEPNAEIGVHEDTFSAVIRPYCEDENFELVEDVTLSVYRREFDGSFREIATGMTNTRATFVVDPHPSLDYARYRIVAISQTTGSVSYCDLTGYPVGGTAVIIQWDETWTDFDVVDDVPTEERQWSGSMLKLPYNIDVAPNYKTDVALVEYIGRRHPVSYYGTQIGETAIWNTVIPAYDKETLYALRRLAIWTGDVYVREPSGSGYWANISVSFNKKHRTTTIPITLNITRVEGGL